LIVIDTSALITIVNREPERPQFLSVIEAADRRLIAAGNILEAKMVILGRFGPDAIADFTMLIEEIDPDIVALDAGQAEAAFIAFTRFGKGRHAKAALNLGDCIAYALAKTMNAPLLFKGNVFRKPIFSRAAETG
jgi:ribonuclease VapC